MRLPEFGEIEFLERLASLPQGARRPDLPLADRTQNRIRQSCRRFGWTVYVDGGWRITPLGRKALARLKGSMI